MGLKLGLVSNTSRDLGAFVRHFGLDVDAWVSSGSHGKVKPSPSSLRPRSSCSSVAAATRSWSATRRGRRRGARGGRHAGVPPRPAGRFPGPPGRIESLRELPRRWAASATARGSRRPRGSARARASRRPGCAVRDHVELPLAAGNRLGGETRVVELGHETRSPFVVARSGGAVVDLDLHAREPTLRVGAHFAGNRARRGPGGRRGRSPAVPRVPGVARRRPLLPGIRPGGRGAAGRLRAARRAPARGA